MRLGEPIFSKTDGSESRADVVATAGYGAAYGPGPSNARNDTMHAYATAAIANKNPELLSALSHCIEKAETALNDGPFSVIDKTEIPPSGDKHDYISLAPYWWPNPETADGLPYIRRDGQTNPERSTDASDAVRMENMANDVAMLARAYGFTGREPYAEHAALLLRTWFLNADTSMNPHLKYGQAIPGIVEGRSTGIIDTTCLVSVVDAAGLLTQSEYWRDNDDAALKQWFKAYSQWLQTSRHGLDESGALNNHGSWYDVQVAGFALFIDDRETAKRILESVGARRIARQIGPDGGQKYELERTRSFDYSIYNLAALFRLADFGEHVGVDLWHFTSEDHASIRGALDYLAPYADTQKEWPHEQITELKRAKLLPLLRQGYHAYENPAYMNMVQYIPAEERTEDMSSLLYPISITKQRT